MHLFLLQRFIKKSAHTEFTRAKPNKANVKRDTSLLTARSRFLKESAAAAENKHRQIDFGFGRQGSFVLSIVRIDGY
jgi:hypothetical protein